MEPNNGEHHDLTFDAESELLNKQHDHRMALIRHSTVQELELALNELRGFVGCFDDKPAAAPQPPTPTANRDATPQHDCVTNSATLVESPVQPQVNPQQTKTTPSPPQHTTPQAPQKQVPPPQVPVLQQLQSKPTTCQPAPQPQSPDSLVLGDDNSPRLLQSDLERTHTQADQIKQTPPPSQPQHTTSPIKSRTTPPQKAIAPRGVMSFLARYGRHKSDVSPSDQAALKRSQFSSQLSPPQSIIRPKRDRNRVAAPKKQHKRANQKSSISPTVGADVVSSQDDIGRSSSALALWSLDALLGPDSESDSDVDKSSKPFSSSRLVAVHSTNSSMLSMSSWSSRDDEHAQRWLTRVDENAAEPCETPAHNETKENRSSTSVTSLQSSELGTFHGSLAKLVPNPER